MTDIDPDGRDGNDEPDFIALYEPRIDGDGWQMTPRMAWHLWTGALYLADEWRHGDAKSLLEALPSVARPYAKDRAWRDQFTAGFERIAERLARGGDDDVLARCTAEELALHTITDLAQAHLSDDIISATAVCHLPDQIRLERDSAPRPSRSAGGRPRPCSRWPQPGVRIHRQADRRVVAPLSRREERRPGRPSHGAPGPASIGRCRVRAPPHRLGATRYRTRVPPPQSIDPRQ